ncbi:hypothetical protein F2Q69_00058979 [Brassica cretica]|uniref:Uncharacterized protein n=1 Tax=Brassica cretica TaxID=69181 RepID=A0A8S9RQL7_BRACR|nr:hypothetical protein F2Q69_00058979 [Brassica cretica]
MTGNEHDQYVAMTEMSSGGILRDLEVQIGNALVPVDFHVLDIKLNWNSSLLLGRDFLSTVGAVCNLQTNQLCLTLTDPHARCNPILGKNPQTSSRRIDDPGLIASCHCGDEYETEYSASLETHTATSIDSAHQKSIDTPKEESVDSSLNDWENNYYNPTMAAHTKDYEEERHSSSSDQHAEEYDEDYKEEQATEYTAILDEEDKLLHHSSWKTNAPSIDRTISTSIDTHPYQTSQNKHRPTLPTTHRLTLEPTVYEKKTTRFHPIDRANRPSIDDNPPSSIDIRPKPPSTVSKNPNYDNQYLTPDEFGIFRDLDGYARAIDGHALQVSIEDIADILQMANGADNLFMQQRTVPAHPQRVTKEFYDTAGGTDNSFKQKYRHPT